MITPPIAGLMIDLLEPHGDVFHLAHLGYKSAFLLASVLLLAAVVFVRQIRVSNKVPAIALVLHRHSRDGDMYTSYISL
jgi:hypothetical protein